MYIFYECNDQPKYYRVFDLDQGGNTQNEQRTVDQMIEALNGMYSSCLGLSILASPNTLKL